MTLDALLKLALQSVTAPRVAAILLLSIRPGREALATAFALVVVAMAVAFSAALLIDPPQNALPMLMGTPIGFMLMQALVLAGTIVGLYFVGRAFFGGKDDFAGLALLMIWMQALRVLMQFAMLPLLPFAPELATLLMLAASVVGIWIALNFVDEALALGGLHKAAGVLVLGLLSMAIALAMLMALIGVTPEGMMNDI